MSKNQTNSCIEEINEALTELRFLLMRFEEMGESCENYVATISLMVAELEAKQDKNKSILSIPKNKK